MRALLIALMSITSLEADAQLTEAELGRDQFRAVAEAVISQNRLNETESIHAIIRGEHDRFGQIFIIQYEDARGNCTQESARVTMTALEDGTVEPLVTFKKAQRSPCASHRSLLELSF